MAFRKSSQKSALTFSCSDIAINFLSGQKSSILESHKVFQGLSKSEFLRFSVAYALTHQPKPNTVLDLMKYVKSSDSFDSFIRDFKGGKLK